MRGRGEGSIYQRRDGRWCAAVSVDGRRRAFYGPTRAEAYRKLREALRAVEDGLPAPSAETLAAYLRAWLKGCQSRGLRQSTLEDYDRLCRIHIIPHLGRVKLAKLTPAQVQAFYVDRLREGVSAPTPGKCSKVLRMALGQAVNFVR